MMCKMPNKRQLLKICNVTGAFLLLIPTGIFFIWGNMSTYVLSYYQSKRPSSMDISWIIALLLIFRGVALVLSEYSIRLVGQKVTILIGIIIFNLGISGSYFALDDSISVLDITLGIITGLGLGLLLGTCLQVAVQWSDESDVGVVTSIVLSGPPFCATFMNEFITLYVNPHNDKADRLYEGIALFSQTSVLKRVPNMFLLLGVIFVALQIVGLCMIRTKPEENQNASCKMTEIQPLTTERSTQQKGNTLSSSSLSTFTETEYGTSVTPPPPITTKEDILEIPCDDTVEPRETFKDHTPKQILRTWTFYLLVLTFMTNEYCFLIIMNYYKIFGEIWIRNDYFITAIGTAVAFLTIPNRIFYGFCIDRVGVKVTIIGGFVVTALCSSVISVLPMTNRYLYFIVATLLASQTAAMENAYAVAVVVCFGRKYSVVNTGMVLLISMNVMFIGPPVLELMVSRGLWSILFFSGAGITIASILAIIAFLPRY